MAVQPYSANEPEIRKNTEYKNNGDSVPVDRMSFAVLTFLACVVFYGHLPLQDRMLFVCPVGT